MGEPSRCAASWRRAPLSGLVAARRASVETAAAGAAEPDRRPHVLRTAPYRPRPKTLPPPSDHSPRGRLLALTGSLAERTPPRVVKATADEAADELIAYLKDHGYL